MNRREFALVFLLLATHAVLLVWSAARNSLTVDEPFHLAAGIRHWQDGQFDIDRGNPPLVGSVAAIPVLLAGPKLDWANAPNSFAVGRDFTTVNGSRSFWLITLGRWACIPFSLLGGYVCFCWSREVYGSAAGIVALLLWCFCPNIIAHGQLITGDMGATAVGIAAFYVFWRWLRKPCFERAFIAGLMLGLAELTKFVWVMLYFLWPALWIIWRLLSRQKSPSSSILREAWHGALIVLLSIYIINLGYAFERPFQPLQQFHTGQAVLHSIERVFGSTDWLASFPVPLPADYLGGIDEIQVFRESQPWTYLQGEWRPGGWWYFYPYAFAIKLPLGTLLLLAFACMGNSSSSDRRTEVFLLVSIAAILMFLCHSSAVQNLRYALPLLPLIYIWIGRVGQLLTRNDKLPATMVVGCLGWSVVSSLCVFPHSLSFFNEVVGGPEQGYWYLTESNIDWGQDVLFLRKWLDKHPEAQPLHLAHLGRIDPRYAGIEYTLPPKATNGRGPRPGWHAVSVTFLTGFNWDHPNGKGATERISAQDYLYFNQFRPVGMAGYSIYIYHISLPEANAVRKAFGMPLLQHENEDREDHMAVVPGGGHEE